MTLRAADLTGGPNNLVAGLDFAVRPGERVALIGPNGSGKSTTLRLLALQLKSSGNIVLNERDARSLRRREFARSVGMLPQEHGSPEGVTVTDLVLRGRYAHHGPLGGVSARDTEAASRAIRDVGLAHLASRPVTHLSGGERQRAWIAMSLAAEPQVLLLDEPTTYLDLAHAHDVLRLVTRLAKERELGVVMVLHDLSQASRFADRLVVLKDGRVRASGPPRDVLTPELLLEVYGVRARVLHDEETGSLHVVPR